jgi:hypothetical protein
MQPVARQMARKGRRSVVGEEKRCMRGKALFGLLVYLLNLKRYNISVAPS